MATLTDALQNYNLGSSNSEARGAMSLPFKVLTTKPGDLQRDGGGTRSSVSEIKQVLTQMVRGLRTLNDQKERQRIIIERMRNDDEEDRREKLNNLQDEQPQTVERVIEEDKPDEKEQPSGMGVVFEAFKKLKDILARIFSIGAAILAVVRTRSLLLKRTIAGSTATTVARSSILRRALRALASNRRVRLILGATAGAMAIEEFAERIMEETPEQEQPEESTIEPGSTPRRPRGSSAPAARPMSGAAPGGPERMMEGMGESSQGLGSLSARYESRGDAGAIGFDSTGGWSYGAYQIATKTGTMTRFLQYLQEKNPDMANTLNTAGGVQGAAAGTDQFKQAWQELSRKDRSFYQAQRQFISDTHYKPLAQKILRETGIDVNKRSRALQEVTHSTAVQHGPGTNVITLAIQRAGGANAKDEDIIREVYNERGTRFGSSTAQVQASVANRFRQERQDALRMLQTERQAPSGQEMAGNQPSQTGQRTSAPITAEAVSPAAETQSTGNSASPQPIRTTQGAPVAQQLQPEAQIPATITAGAEEPGTDVIVVPLLIERTGNA